MVDEGSFHAVSLDRGRRRSVSQAMTTKIREAPGVAQKLHDSFLLSNDPHGKAWNWVARIDSSGVSLEILLHYRSLDVKLNPGRRPSGIRRRCRRRPILSVASVAIWIMPISELMALRLSKFA